MLLSLLEMRYDFVLTLIMENKGVWKQGFAASDDIALERIEAVVQNLNPPRRFTPEHLRRSPHLKGRVGSFSIPGVQTELRQLVKMWLDSGPNLRKMFQENPELARRAQNGITHLIPSETGGGYLLWMPELLDEDVKSMRDGALVHFMSLIANPMWELLGGPCRRCGDFYLKRTKGQRTYCTQKCGSKATAGSAMKAKRQKEHDQKIAKAQKLIKQWEERKRRIDWRQWVSSKPGFTDRWLTRAVNKGQLIAPQPPQLTSI